MDIDVGGPKKLLDCGISCNCIAILPPSIEELRNRLIGRNTDSLDSISKRIEIATTELREIEKCDLFHSNLLNDDLEESYSKFKSIIIELYPYLN